MTTPRTLILALFAALAVPAFAQPCGCGQSAAGAIDPCAPVPCAAPDCTAVAPPVRPFSVPCFDLSGALPPCHPPCVEPKLSVRDLKAHYRMQNEVVARNAAEAQAAIDHAAGKWARQTMMVGAVQDQFGDPMYTEAGPRAYAGTPHYVGPAYTASFERGYVVPGTDMRDRGHERAVYARPQERSRTDAGLRAGATHSYLQSGMMRNPGSMAPSGSRPAALNH